MERLGPACAMEIGGEPENGTEIRESQGQGSPWRWG